MFNFSLDVKFYTKQYETQYKHQNKQKMYVWKLDLHAKQHRQMSPVKMTPAAVETRAINHVSVSKQNI